MANKVEAWDNLRGLLGELEREVMTWLWQQPLGEITVRQAYEAIAIDREPPLAYTTIMTIMAHLADKGLLTRRHAGKTHYYTVALTKDEFLARSAARQVEQLVANFGDLALAQFAEQLAAADPQRLANIRRLTQPDEERA